MTGPGGRGQREGESGGGSAAVLRAIGSLLVTLSGGDEHAQERAQRFASEFERGEPAGGSRAIQREPGGGTTGRDEGARRETIVTNPPGGLRPPRPDSTTESPPGLPGDHPPPSAIPPSSRGGADEVEWLLADARARAQQILDESMEKAEELLAQRTSGVSGRVLAEIRRTVADLVEGMTEVRQRLARIETLLEERETERPASRARPGSPEAEPRAGAMPSIPARPDRPPFSVVSPDAPRSTAPPTPSSAPPSATPPIPPGGPVHHEPPLAPWRAAGDEASAAAEPRRAPPTEPRPQGAAAPETPAASSAPPRSPEPPQPAPPRPEPPPPVEDTYQPDRGAVLLRVSPVAGFQGLMRVQDALGRIDAVRQATVEAYAQGEARLRLELAAPIRPNELAGGLARALDQRAEVRSASIPERSVLIALS